MALQVMPANSASIKAVSLASTADDTIEYWIPEINKSLRNAAASLIATGIKLIKAKDRLGHGNWMNMFEPGKLRFSLRTATMLMRIAHNGSFRKEQCIANLPASIVALHELAIAEPEVIQRGVIDGKIHPEMTVGDARAFVATHRQKQPPALKQARPFDSTKRLARITRHILAEVEHWPAVQRNVLAQALQELADNIATPD